MIRVIGRVMAILSLRLFLPAVCLLFLLMYIAVAFFTDEALVTLVQLAGHNPLVLGLLGLAAVNAALRMSADFGRYRLSRQAAAGTSPTVAEGGGAQSLAISGQLDIPEIGRILAGEGYRIRTRDGFVAGVRGVSLICPRLLWRLTLVLLFAGVALSLATRGSKRIPVIEGEPLQVRRTVPRTVTRIALEDVPGHWFLQKRLTISLTDVAGVKSTYGIYPPGMLDGGFLYPRYPGVAPLLLIAAPGRTEPLEGYQLIMLYPPGREDTVKLANGYRAQLVIRQRDGMPDPFVSGRFDLHIKVLQADTVITEGDIPFGGRFEGNGFSVALPDAKRFVVTDFVRDYGVFCIWLSSAAALLALLFYLPVRLLAPYRVMVFTVGASPGQIVASCSAEGKRRRHEALFHDLLDKICRQR